MRPDIEQDAAWIARGLGHGGQFRPAFERSRVVRQVVLGRDGRGKRKRPVDSADNGGARLFHGKPIGNGVDRLPQVIALGAFAERGWQDPTYFANDRSSHLRGHQTKPSLRRKYSISCDNSFTGFAGTPA